MEAYNRCLDVLDLPYDGFPIPIQRPQALLLLEILTPFRCIRALRKATNIDQPFGEGMKLIYSESGEVMDPKMW